MDVVDILLFAVGREEELIHTLDKGRIKAAHEVGVGAKCGEELVVTDGVSLDGG